MLLAIFAAGTIVTLDTELASMVAVVVSLTDPTLAVMSDHRGQDLSPVQLKSHGQSAGLEELQVAVAEIF